jgi:hypothetical protein
VIRPSVACVCPICLVSHTHGTRDASLAQSPMWATVMCPAPHMQTPTQLQPPTIQPHSIAGERELKAPSPPGSGAGRITKAPRWRRRTSAESRPRPPGVGPPLLPLPGPRKQSPASSPQTAPRPRGPPRPARWPGRHGRPGLGRPTCRSCRGVPGTRVFGVQFLAAVLQSAIAQKAWVLLLAHSWCA